MKRNLIYHDLIVNCDVCNFHCAYCTSKEFGSQYARNDLSEANIPEIRQVITTMQEKTAAPILKISGGELYTIRNIDELLRMVSGHYEYVQVLTNGSLVSHQNIDHICSLGNVGLNISLDGHTMKMNKFRFRDPAHLAHILDIIRYASEKLGYVEITSVITDTNYEDYFDFLDHLGGISRRVKCIPIPVRGEKAFSFFSPENRAAFANMLAERWQGYQDLLPPASYCMALADFLRGGSRKTKQCLVPYFAIQFFDSGDIVPCPLGWTGAIGNTRHAQCGEELRLSNKIYKLLLYHKPLLGMCADCFSIADMITMFLKDEASCAELAAFEMFAPASIQQHLMTVKQQCDAYFAGTK